MITDIKVMIREALLANAELIAALKGPRIYQLAAPDPEEYPRITFFEVTNRDAAFADDKVIGAEVIVQIDVWSKESTSLISGEVDKTMKQLGYTRTSAPDLYEPEEKIYHKAMRFKNLMEDGE